MIEDEVSSTDIRTRRAFGACVKDATVNAELSVHAKGKQAITLPFFRRITLSVNDEAENLMIVPPMDGSIREKVFLFKCLPASVGEDRAKTMAGFRSEMPALTHKLLNWKIPKEMQCSRFGVKAWQHPELLCALEGLSPEQALLDVIEEALFPDDAESMAFPPRTFRGTARELVQKLRESKFASDAAAVLRDWGAACGVYLSRLSQRHPERFKSVTVRGKTVWTITERAREAKE